MNRKRIARELAPVLAAVVAAFLIELGAQTTGWAAAWTYALVGIVSTCLVLIGVPFALGYRFALEPPAVTPTSAKRSSEYLPPSLSCLDLASDTISLGDPDPDPWVVHDFTILRNDPVLESGSDDMMLTRPSYSFLIADRQKTGSYATSLIRPAQALDS